MGVILGLNCNHADSSACLIKDGKLLVAIEEERINRIKHWAGLPINSIKECLKNSKINKKNPLDLAETLALIIKESDDFIENANVAKPGFINIKFKS